MPNLKVSACYHPTSLVLTDDHKDFLEATCLELSELNPCQLFDKPFEALAFLNNTIQNNSLLIRCVKEKIDPNFDEVSVITDIRIIHQEIYNPNRFKNISMIIADYAMPGMSGLELLKQVKSKTIKKLMLTGAMDHYQAIQAFNENVIDQFIPKDDSRLVEKLKKSIHQLTSLYFNKVSESLLNENSRIAKKLWTLFKDQKFIQLFNQILEKNNIIEHYLLDEHGSFLFLDKYANPSWFIVKSHEDMDGIFDFAKDHHPPKQRLDALKNKKVVPYFHTEEDWNIGYADPECDKYLHPASMLKGEQSNYYYAYVKNPNAYHLEKNKILSFEKYMENEGLN